MPVTLPTDYLNSVFYGDIDVLAPTNATEGTGAVYIRNSDFYVFGLTDLRETSIDTTAGSFNIYGTQNAIVNVGGHFSLTGVAASSLTTTAGVLSLSSSATNASGKISISAAGTGTDSVLVTATNAISGQVHLSSAGAANPSVLVEATNAAGQTLIRSSGTGVDAVKIHATAGGVSVNATNVINFNTTDTTNGIKIGVDTATVPVTIGSVGSLTTIKGDVYIQGTTTTINTTQLTVDQNILVLNSGNTVAGYDASVAIKRYQNPNNAGTGSVVASTPIPVQESGAFQTGSATPGTLVLSTHANSTTTDYYKGWWILVKSGTGINQVRRIKSYNQSTKTATIYVNADNGSAPPGPTTEIVFSDGLDLVTAPAAADTYELYNSAYVAYYYDEVTGFVRFYTLNNTNAGISAAAVQQPQNSLFGEIDSRGKTFNNALGSASTTTITVTLKSHTLVTGNYVRISNSLNFTPSIPDGRYLVESTPTGSTFTFSVGASTTSASNSSVSIYLYTTSVLKVDNIVSYDPEYPLQIQGAFESENLVIPKTSTATVTINKTVVTGNAYMLLVCDITGTGASAVFVCTSAGAGGNPQRLISQAGGQNQRLTATWVSGQKIKIGHQPAGSGVGNYTYTVKIIPCF